jgi:HSP20 family protein
MPIVKWDPWREIDDMFERYMQAGGVPGGGGRELARKSDWTPRVDIAETEKAFVIKVEVPEVEKDDVAITVDNGVLSIRGERKREKEEKGKTFHRIERSYGEFTRLFTLPENVDANNIKATFKDGMLSLEIPKTEKAKPKAIEVKVE